MSMRAEPSSMKAVQIVVMRVCDYGAHSCSLLKGHRSTRSVRRPNTANDRAGDAHTVRDFHMGIWRANDIPRIHGLIGVECCQHRTLQPV